MGSIRTTGNASREVEYDKMRITVSFNACERRSRDAIRKVTEECEQFLGDLKELGFEVDIIRGGGNSVSKNRYSDEKSIDAERGLEWDSKDAWKEEFMLQMRAEAIPVKIFADDNKYKIWGFHFLNQDARMKEFDEEFAELTGRYTYSPEEMKVAEEPAKYGEE